jgi:hypothetical protein
LRSIADRKINGAVSWFLLGGRRFGSHNATHVGQSVALAVGELHNVTSAAASAASKAGFKDSVVFH